MGSCRMANVVSHDLFPTKIHEFEYTPEHYDYTNMVQYIESKNQSAPLYQTEDDIHTISFFKDSISLDCQSTKLTWLSNFFLCFNGFLDKIMTL